MTQGPYAVQLKYLNEYDKVETLDLSSGGYAIQETTPSVLRVYGEERQKPEDGKGYDIQMTMVVPLDRVLSLCVADI